jgi:hypothetical protein
VVFISLFDSVFPVCKKTRLRRFRLRRVDLKLQFDNPSGTPHSWANLVGAAAAADVAVANASVVDSDGSAIVAG